MQISELPLGSNPESLPCPHFPAGYQAVIFRNWEIIPPSKLAELLHTTEENIILAAGDMGLFSPGAVSSSWLTRGYLTIIRNNWHLLPYEQLLELLGWTADRLEAVLLEEDFLWHKLGDLKPKCAMVLYRTLSPEEKIRTSRIRQIINKYFPDRNTPAGEKPFDFVKTLSAPIPNSGIKKNEKKNKSNFDLQYIFSYLASTGDVLLDMEERDPYPEGLLSRYAALGVNGIWLQAILYQLFPWEPAMELSAGYEKRLTNLRILTERARKYGIGLYLYLNEPRSLPLRFFENHKKIKGVTNDNGLTAALCTSNQDVLDFIEDAAADVFKKVPGLAGFFTISMSENLTHCHSRGYGERCPLCAPRPVSEIVAEINNALERGAHRSKPDARIIAWNWAWNFPYNGVYKDWAPGVIEKLHPGVEIQCTSEEAMATRIGGISGIVLDYTISQPGPGERAKNIWRLARAHGLKTAAKVQFNNSWECSAVPYIPVPQLVEEHQNNLKNEGVNSLMLSWTLGGYPSANLKLLNQSVEEYALENFGSAAEKILKVYNIFSNSFREFPFNITVLYNGPQNYGPKNLLYEKPTGYRSSMVGFPYDCVEGWCAMYPADVLETQFEKLSQGWKTGLDLLESISHEISHEHLENYSELKCIAGACYCHFRSSFLQTKFVRLRDCGLINSPEMKNLLDEETDLAVMLMGFCRQDSRIGFEASNHYYYTASDLMEKVLNCDFLKNLSETPSSRKI